MVVGGIFRGEMDLHASTTRCLWLEGAFQNRKRLPAVVDAGGGRFRSKSYLPCALFKVTLPWSLLCETLHRHMAVQSPPSYSIFFINGSEANCQVGLRALRYVHFTVCVQSPVCQTLHTHKAVMTKRPPHTSKKAAPQCMRCSPIFVYENGHWYQCVALCELV